MIDRTTGHHHSSSHLVVISFIVFICFGRSLLGGFVFDDYEAIVKNDDLNIERNWIKLFEHDFWGANITAQSSHKSYRPLTVITFRIINLIGSSLESSKQKNPTVFRVVNLVAYWILCCLLHHTIKYFLTSPLIKIPKKTAVDISLSTSLLFACHPVHCESVSSCVGLADILSAFVSLIAFRAYLSTTYLWNEIKWSTLRTAYFCLASLMTALLVGVGMLFKEQAVTYLGIFVLLNMLHLWTHWHTSNTNVRLAIIFQIGLFLVVALLLLYFRLWVMDFKPPVFSKMDNPASRMDNTFMRGINYSYIYLWNLILIICPLWLCFDWSMGCIPLIHSWHDPRFTLVVVFLIILGLIIFRLLLNLNQSKFRTMFIYSLFCMLPYLPSSNLFFQVGFVIAERNLFMPLLGYQLILTTSLHWWLSFKDRSKHWWLSICFYCLLLLFSVRSFMRTEDWITEQRLFEKDANVCPGNAKIFYNIGKLAADAGNVEKAVINYRHSLFLNENYTNALNNYANILKDQGYLKEAKVLLEKACTLEPKFATAWMNLAIVEMSLKNYHQAEKHYQLVISLRPNHANSHYNFGNLYLQWKKFSLAERCYLRAVQLNNTMTRAWNNLILLKQNSKQLDKALQLVEKALTFNPGTHSLHFMAGNLYGEKGQFEQSESHFQQAIRLNSTAINYRYNLAVLYQRHGMLLKARQYYQEVVTLDPLHHSARRQLQKLKNVEQSNSSTLLNELII